MGVGDPLEATLRLAGPIKAGNWHLIGDAIVLAPVDARYEVIWRHGGTDTPIVDWAHHFDLATGAAKFDAQLYEDDAAGSAVPATSGDQLVLRFSVDAPDSGAPGVSYIPNSDGSATKGRIPSLTLPK